MTTEQVFGYAMDAVFAASAVVIVAACAWAVYRLWLSRNP